MLITDKAFFAATLMRTVGCSPATFRAWRNRNGLFPETRDSGGWNKFSVIDILVTAIIFELTKMGMGAQLAVDAAMKAAPEIEELYGTPSVDQKCDLGAVVVRMLNRLPRHDFPMLEITNPNRSGVAVRLVRPKELSTLEHMSVSSSGHGLPLVATLVYLSVLCTDILIDLVSFEEEYGRARVPTELSTPPPQATIDPPQLGKKK